MMTCVCLTIALLVVPGWSQALPTATAGPDTQSDDPSLSQSPMVSGKAIPTKTLSEVQSNYLDAEIAFRPSYDDNLLPNYGSRPISDVAYSINPSIEFDKSTSRLHQTWTYRPGFTLYQRTAARNEADQSAAAAIEYRWSPHITVSGHDIFQKSSNIFNQPFSLAGEQISGAPPSSPANIIVPYASQLTNVASAQGTYQFSLNETIGASGTATIFNYLNQAESPGLYDSTSRGGSVFYNQRLTSRQSIGATYQYVRVLGNPTIGQLKIQTNTLFLFFTAAVGDGFSISMSAGPQHYDYAQASLPGSSSLTAAITASVGWQAQKTSLAASYSRTATTGAGQLGALISNTANLAAHWQLNHTWTVSVSTAYVLYSNIATSSVSSSLGGYSISGSCLLDHSLSDHLTAQAGYQRIHQIYNGLAVITSDPDVDSVVLSFSYRFKRPLGR